ncbi:MAG: hypothetical protein H8F28_14760, partial [Fibrella sp.]|nr:hypothetical protein [Armatimonadota bacterium]
MNETTPAADSNVAENAPIPWLGDKPALKGAPEQEWRLAAHGDVLLEVAYRYRIRD